MQRQLRIISTYLLSLSNTVVTQLKYCSVPHSSVSTHLLKSFINFNSSAFKRRGWTPFLTASTKRKRRQAAGKEQGFPSALAILLNPISTLQRSKFKPSGFSRCPELGCQSNTSEGTTRTALKVNLMTS